MPLLVWLWGVDNPFLFAAATKSGEVVVATGMMLLCFRRLLCDLDVWRVALRSCVTWERLSKVRLGHPYVR